jgi:methylglutaconyl-CoA hydratase
MTGESAATESVTLQVAAGVATMTLNRPELGNRYDPAMLSKMARYLAAVTADPRVRALVLRGAGRHFCVGADVGWHETAPAIETTAFLDLLLDLDALPMPVVAVAHGACVGGGLAFAACSDIVLAERGTVFAIPEVRLGLCPASLIPLFQRAIGSRAFRRYGLTGEKFSAATAQQLGLVSEVFDGAPDPLLAPLLESIRLGSPAAISRTKALSAATAPLDADRMQAWEAEFIEARQHPDAKEGSAAFREKRLPRWYKDTME